MNRIVTIGCDIGRSHSMSVIARMIATGQVLVIHDFARVPASPEPELLVKLADNFKLPDFIDLAKLEKPKEPWRRGRPLRK